MDNNNSNDQVNIKITDETFNSIKEKEVEKCESVIIKSNRNSTSENSDNVSSSFDSSSSSSNRNNSDIKIDIISNNNDNGDINENKNENENRSEKEKENVKENENKNESSKRKRLYEIIEVATTGDIPSMIYDFIIMFTIILSLTPLAFRNTNIILDYIDYCAVTIFIIDYILRWITADFKLKKKFSIAFVQYPITPWAIIDLLSILPSLNFLYSSLRLLRVFNLIKTLRIVRAFKVFRYSNSIIIISEVIQSSKSPLTAVGGLAFGYILISALVIFNVEDNEAFPSFFSAVYWATVSLTTVGYGDIYPLTTPGRIVAMVSSVCGIALVALPAGIITAGYMDSLTVLYKKNEDERKIREKELKEKRREKRKRKQERKEMKIKNKREKKERKEKEKLLKKERSINV